MKIRILEEHGHHAAICGLCQSYQELPDDLDDFNSQAKIELAKRLAVKDGGHNKFLESINVQLDIKAPVYWWQEFDTYRCGITKQSESKMHTLGKRLLTQNDFEGGIEPIILRIVNEFITAKDFLSTLRNLPLSFLQRRQLCANYKALRTICNQRRGHKLSQWKQFVDHMETELMWPWAVMQHEERFDEHELIIALKEAVDLVDDKYIRSLLLVSSETINDLQTVIQNQEAENRNREANHD